jgi:hypothetical protein
LPAEAAGFCGFDEAERFIALLYHEEEAVDLWVDKIPHLPQLADVGVGQA